MKKMCQNQFRVCRWDQSVWERQPETSWCQTGGDRHRVQGLLLVHDTRRRRPHRQLGGRWKRIPGHRRPPPNSSTHAWARRQHARRSEGGRSSVNNCTLLNFNRMYITLTYPKNFDTSWAWVNDKITLKQTRNKTVISSWKISSYFVQSRSWKFKGKWSGLYYRNYFRANSFNCNGKFFDSIEACVS